MMFCDDQLIDVAAFLLTREAGPIDDISDLERKLAAAWTVFEGHDSDGMTPEKLLGRMEEVEWSPPALSFVIERHGGTCLGSTRADLHRWTINFIERTATCEKVGHRQLRPMARRLSIQPFAEEVASRVVQGQEDDRLIWQTKGAVRVAISSIFPSDSGYKQTVEGRRSRFMQALVPLLEGSGWQHVGRCLFIKEGTVPPIKQGQQRNHEEAP